MGNTISDSDGEEGEEGSPPRQLGELLLSLNVVRAMIASGSGPDSATGTTEQVIERLQHLRGLGCEYVICYFPEAAYDRSGIELFEREVIPALS